MCARLLLGLAALAGSGGAAIAHEAALSRYNYWEHVRPIFVEHCGACHREGGVGPMSLLDYQQAVPWANAIKLQLLARRMPPFLPEDENGPFAGARSLTAEELDVLIDWTVGATPEGAVRLDVSGGPLAAPSEPDVVLTGPELVLSEDEYEKAECLVLSTGLAKPRTAVAFEVRSKATSTLRRATIFLGEACRGGEPVITWLPDQNRVNFPEGFGREIPAAGRLSVELVYEKGWEDEADRIVDRVDLALSFRDDATSLATARVESRTRLSQGPVEIIALYPVPSGPPSVEPLRVESVSPGGERRELLSIQDFDPAWSEKYVFRRPVVLSAGSEIVVSSAMVWVDFIAVGTPANE